MKRIITIVALFMLICLTVNASVEPVMLRVEKGEYLMEISNPLDWELIVRMQLTTDGEVKQKDYKTGIRPFASDIYGAVTLPEWNEKGQEHIQVCWYHIPTKERFCGIVNDTPEFDEWYFVRGSYSLYLPSVYLESVND